MSGPRDLKWNACRLLVETHFAPQPVLSSHLTVIRRVDDDGVIREALFLKCVHESADAFIKLLNHAEVGRTRAHHLVVCVGTVQPEHIPQSHSGDGQVLQMPRRDVWHVHSVRVVLRKVGFWNHVWEVRGDESDA